PGGTGEARGDGEFAHMDRSNIRIARQPDPDLPAPGLPDPPAVAPLLLLLLWYLGQTSTATGIPRRTLERERAAGRFPAPDVVIGKRPRWKSATITAWIDSQKGGRR